MGAIRVGQHIPVHYLCVLCVLCVLCGYDNKSVFLIAAGDYNML